MESERDNNIEGMREQFNAMKKLEPKLKKGGICVEADSCVCV
jgi:hypothetical protein